MAAAAGRASAIHAGARQVRQRADRGGGGVGSYVGGGGGASSSRQLPKAATQRHSEGSQLVGRDLAAQGADRWRSGQQRRPEGSPASGTTSGWVGDGDGEGVDFQPLPAVAVAPYLEAYGYAAADAETWRPVPLDQGASSIPRLSFVVAGHEEVLGHTWYVLACSLELSTDEGNGAATRRLDWQARRRLVQLREQLHDRVKALIGETRYSQIFADARFAPKGGLPGTTARLNGWFAALAASINQGRAPPSLTAVVFQFLDIPEFPERRDGGGGESTEGDTDIEISMPGSEDDVRRKTSENTPSGFSTLRNVAAFPGAASCAGSASSAGGSALAEGAAAAAAPAAKHFDSAPAPRSQARPLDDSAD